MAKQYGSAETYENKLHRVMERMGADDYNYSFDRHGAWVEFYLNGQLYRFDHTKEKAEARGIKLSYGSDCLAQIVLSLQDLARMAERGIYELQTWLAGMKFLAPPIVLPECYRALGFEEMPDSIEDIDARYKNLAKKAHPDVGGSMEEFIRLKENAELAAKDFKSKNRV